MYKRQDVVISIGSRMSDFTTSSKHLFQNEDVQFVSINNCRFHAYKMDAVKAVGDAKATVEALAEKLRARGYKSAYTDEIEKAKAAWYKDMERLGSMEYTGDDFEPLIKARDPRTIPEYVKLTNGKITQTAALAAINRTIDKDATIITAGGSLPSCMQRMWRTDKRCLLYTSGAGKRQYECPGILRAMLIRESEDEASGNDTCTETDTIIKLESNIDDCTGETLCYVM